MLEVLIFINEALDEWKTLRTNLLDFSKVFDTVDHNIMLQKLEYYGIRGPPLQLLQTFLTDRKQLVE